jgi:hypothetical protein
MHTRIRRKLPRAFLAAVLAVAALALPASASAATQTVNPTFSGSGNNTDIVSLLAVCDECAPDAFFSDPTGFINTWGFGLGATVQAKASWSNPSSIAMDYTQSNLRHGQTLDLADTLTTNASSVHVDYSLTGVLGLFGTDQTGSLSCAVVVVSGAGCNGWLPTTDTLTIGPITGSDDIPCTMPLPGESPRNCTNTKTIPIWSTDLFDFVSINVDLVLEETVQVTGSGVTSLRIAVINGGQAIPNRSLAFAGSSPSTVADPISISCSQPVGNDLLYSLTGNSYTADPATYTGDVKIKVSASAFGFGGSFTTPPLAKTTGANLGPLNMSAPDQQVDLGPVLANNIAPTVNAGGPYTGVEGTPVTFDGTGSTSVCGFDNLTLVWSFSDGGVAYGATPKHTFLSPGTFSGLLTVTDSDGNTASKAFSVEIGNLAPVANAGPDMSTKWGIPITLNGSAVDPGTDEQPFLTYSWTFGDGTPSASGGVSVNHTYKNPGTYVATFTACDPENLCDSSQAQVQVGLRDTTTTYTGPNQSNPSKYVDLTATVVDEFGQAVPGASVLFVLGSQSISGTTNSSGVASATIKLNQKHGTYTVSATFAGNTKYVGSADSTTFTIGQ